MEETIQYAVKSELNAATFSIFSPIPGTDIYNDSLEKGLFIGDFKMSGYMVTDGKPLAPVDTYSDINKMVRIGLLRFYSRPDRAFELLRGMEFRTFMNRFKTIFLGSSSC